MQELGLLIVILILGTILSVYGFSDAKHVGGTNTFLNAENLVGQLATYMAVYAIMAVGQTAVIITGGIDISVGSIYALSALGAAAVLQRINPEAPAWQVLPVAMLVGPGIGAICGLCNGILITTLRLHPFIVTLGTLSIFRGIANVATQGATLPFQGQAIPDAFTTNLVQRYFFEPPDGLGGVQLTPLFIMLAVAVVGWFYLWATVAGRETYAVGGNETAAKFSGINVGRVKRRVYLISGLTAGIAGTLALGYFGTANADYGRGYELTVIAAAVVGGASLTGGRGTALGAVLGALTIRLIENAIFKLHLNQQYSQIIVGASIILAVTIDRLSEYIRKRRLAAAN